MAERSTMGTYGAPFKDEGPVENPQSQTSAALYNRKCEDLAHMTRTAWRAIVKFVAVTDAATFVLPANQVFIQTAWGNASTYKPTVTKTATGLYSVQFPSSFTDALGNEETLQFFDATARGRTSVNTDDPEGTRVLSVGSNLVTLCVKDAGVLADAAASVEFITVTTYIL